MKDDWKKRTYSVFGRPHTGAELETSKLRIGGFQIVVWEGFGEFCAIARDDGFPLRIETWSRTPQLALRKLEIELRRAVRKLQKLVDPR